MQLQHERVGKDSRNMILLKPETSCFACLLAWHAFMRTYAAVVHYDAPSPGRWIDCLVTYICIMQQDDSDCMHALSFRCISGRG